MYTLNTEAGNYIADGLLVKNCQDLNQCQQALALKAGRRLILCGDPKQAIYGFTGADSAAMKTMWETLKSTPRGAKWLPLTVTRRCGRKIVTEANKFVQDFEAHETCPEGKVLQGKFEGKKVPVFPIGLGSDDTEADYMPGHNPRDWNYRSFVKDGDMILSRTNAPLISECFKFIKEGRKANIQGRNIGAGLQKLVEKFKAKTMDEFFKKLQDWYEVNKKRESAKEFPSEGVLIALADKRDCLEYIAEECQSVDEIIPKIEGIFTDDSKEGILLSSGHKAKGLEATNVFLLDVTPFPHPMAKSESAVEQEYNLRYVMITRAIETLTYVR